MPENDTFQELYGGKANGISPDVREEMEAEAAASTGKDGAGRLVQQDADAAPAPAVVAAKGANQIDKISTVETALPAAQVQANAEAKPQLAGQPKTLNEGERLTRVLTALGFDAPETPEEKAKREKNEKWEKILSAVGDGVSAMAGLYFAGQTGISNYSAEHSMSAKTKARWDKINADRKANQKAYADAAIRVQGMLDQNQHWRDQMAQQQKEFEFKQQQAKQSQDNFMMQFQYQKEKDDKAWDRLLANDKQAQDNWEKTFNQNQSKINFQQEQAKKEYTLARQKLGAQTKNDNIDFLVGDGETISLPKATLNAANISYLFNTLPEDVRKSVHGQKVYSQYGGYEIGEKPLTSDEMLTVVFANVSTSENTANALRTLAGQPQKKTKNPKDLEL